MNSRWCVGKLLAGLRAIAYGRSDEESMDAPLVPLTVAPRDKLRLAFMVNGEARDAGGASYKTLLEVLREDLGLTGTKHGCELGECGACAVILDGELVLS